MRLSKFILGNRKLDKSFERLKLESEKGVSAIYLWFYEWNMFDAVRKGEHTPSSQHSSICITSDNCEALLSSESIELECKCTSDGADLSLMVRNSTDYEWPRIAGIIPCLNPGGPRTRGLFSDLGHRNTFFLGPDGLELLRNRDIHFNHQISSSLIGASDSSKGKFVFSGKWPTSRTDAYGGILIRESVDGEWVTGIAWESVLSVQGHNPLDCMHVCINIGPLNPSETKRIRGKIYLFKGSRDDCLSRYLEDFQFCS